MLLLIIIVLQLSYLVFRLRRRNFENSIEKFSGPYSFPLIGNIYEFFRSKNAVLQRIQTECLKYESPSRIWLFGKPLLFIYDAENIQLISNKVLNKGRIHGFFKYLLGDGLLTVDNKETWKKQRRLLTPAFSSNATIYYLEHFNKINHDLVQEFETLSKLEKEVNIWRVIFEFEYKKAARALMDYEIDFKSEIGRIQFQEYYEALKMTYGSILCRILQPWFYSDDINRLNNFFNDKKLSRDQILQLTQLIFNNGNNKEKISITGSSNKKVNLIQLLLDDKGLRHYGSDRAIMDEILTFLESGTTTSATTTCFTLLMLAIHQSSQDIVRDEINQVLDEDEPLTREKLDKLTYLGTCIKETLRMFPAVPFLIRNSDKDIKLKDGRIIPTGTEIILNILSMHRNPRDFPFPDTWNPRRFNNEISKLHPCNYIPFGTGPRQCIGYKYALLSIKTQVVTLLRKFRLTTGLKMRDIELDFNVVLINKNRHKLRVHRILENGK